MKPDFLHVEWRKSISSCRYCLAIASLAALVLVLFYPIRIVHASQVTLEWDPVIHPDLAGYMVYYGTSSLDYNETMDVGNWTSVTIAGLEEDVTYYFAVAAYSVYDEQSEYSMKCAIIVLFVTPLVVGAGADASSQLRQMARLP